MALTQVRVSDMSGEPIPEQSGARVRVMYFDESRPDRRADLTDAEVEVLLPFAAEVETRPGRRARRDS